MSNRRALWPRILAVAVAVCLSGLSGCGHEQPSGGTTGRASDSSGDQHDQPNAKESPNRNTADRALLRVVEGLRENRPQVIWDFLPPSYRSEINLLARDFGRRMDAELWSATAEVAGKLARLLSERKEEILSHPALREGPLSVTADWDARWDGLLVLLHTLADSELGDTRRLETFDGRAFLARFDEQSLRQLRELTVLLRQENPFHMLPEMLDGAEIQLVDEADGRATVRIRPTQGEPRDYEFVLVEGQWFPKGWAEDLKNDLAAARAKLEVELAPEVVARKKEIVLPYLREMAAVLDRLVRAEKSEFHAVLTEEVVKPFLQMRDVALQPSGAGTAASIGAAEQGSGTAAVVVVVGQLSPDEIDLVADALLTTDDAVDRDLTIDRRPQTTNFLLTPVGDLNAFARLIEFGRVTKIDAEARQIVVELTPEEAP